MTIDWWTLGIQTVNVLVLIWLLQHFFWRPVSAMIEQRRSTALRDLDAAKSAQDKADAALRDVANIRAGFGKERDDILTGAHADAEKARSASLDDAARQVASRDATAQARLAKEKDAAEGAWSDHAGQLAVDIAGRLAARLQGPAVDTAFLDWMVSGIRALPDTARQAAAAEGAAVVAISARPLAASEQERYRAIFDEAFGAHPMITFEDDAALIAGLELTGPHFTVSNSWRADLGRILAEITHAT